MNASKISFLSILTILIYSFSIFLNTGKLVFPYPLFDLILFFNALLYLFIEFREKQKNRIPGLVLVISFGLNLCNNVYLGSFFYEKDFFNWMNSDLINWIALFVNLTWLIGVIMFLSNLKAYRILMIFIVTVVFIMGQIDGLQWLFLLIPIPLYGLFVWQKTNKIWKNIFLTQGVFNLLTLLMFKLYI